MRSRRTSLSERWVRSPKLTTVFSNDRSEGQILYHGRLEEDLKETSMSTHRRRTIYIYIYLSCRALFALITSLIAVPGNLYVRGMSPPFLQLKKGSFPRRKESQRSLWTVRSSPTAPSSSPVVLARPVDSWHVQTRRRSSCLDQRSWL